MSLSDFVTEPQHSVARERLLHLKASYEMRLYAAQLGEQMQLTEPEIDNYGYDFTLVSGHHSMQLQNKAALSPGGARTWQIRASLLKAHFAEKDLMPQLDGQDVSGWSDGATGGVLLHLIDRKAAADNHLVVRYAYLDIFVLLAAAAGFLQSSRSAQGDAVELLRTLRDVPDNARLVIPLRMFLRVNSAAAPVAFRMGLRPTNYVSAIGNVGSLDGPVANPTIAESWLRYVRPWLD